jgi:beta-glucosidase
LLESGKGTTGERGAAPLAPIHFADAKAHRIRLEYLHSEGSAGIDLTWQAPAEAIRAEAVKAAREADVVVACLGLSPSLEGEEMPIQLAGFSGGDRTAIDLPASQEELLKALVATGKPVVVVLENGSALSVNYAAQHAAAILEAWYPGEEGGTAIADTLAGVNDPAGRLPVTFYASLSQLPPMDDYSMKARTYRYFTGKPLFPFGFGLSYTTFAYSGVKVGAATVHAGEPVQVEADVKNTGTVAGDEVVELYLTQPKSALTPKHVLAGFHRVHLGPGESAHVGFTLDARSLGQVTATGDRVVEAGEYKAYVAGGQPSRGDVSAGFTVEGSTTLPK